MQLWNQPEIDYFVNDNPVTSSGFGTQFITAVNYDFISGKHISGITFHVGYKTEGYSQGEQLDKGLIIRGGLSFKLGNKSQ